jgi:molybdopterin-synthase adenylyltransferase
MHAIGREARHLALPQIGAEGQARIASSTVLMIGLGGIGCASASYLASSGVGRLLLSDFDSVDASNLGRQILYTPEDIGKPKVSRAAAHLAALNADIGLVQIPHRLQSDALIRAVLEADVVLDGCDNFATRFQINAACVENSTLLISGSAIRFEGQLAVFGPDYGESSCYRCLYQEADETLDNCAGNGVLAPVPGVIGSMMAVEALKFLSGNAVNSGVLHLYDALDGSWRKLCVPKRGDCPVCSRGTNTRRHRQSQNE